MIFDRKVFGFKPISYFSQGLVITKYTKIYLSSVDVEDIKFLCKVPTSFIYRLISKSRLLSRILRLEIRCGLVIDDETFYFIRKNELWKVDLTTGHITLDFMIPKNRSALYISYGSINNRKYIVFGEYFNNKNKEEVNVWGKDLSSNLWCKMYTFNKGLIHHIHNTIIENEKIYIFTGDFNKEVQICYFDPSDNVINNLLSGEQSYRCCWASFFRDYIFYGTDTQIEQNHIRQINLSDLSQQNNICELEGSSIYGTSLNDYQMLFSTTVEPDIPSGNFLLDLFDTRIGPGIKSKNATLCILDMRLNEVIKIFELEKDFWPMTLAGFGTFTFPSGLNKNSNTIIAYSSGLKKMDNYTIVFKM